MTTLPTPDELRSAANAARDLGPDGPPIMLSAAAVEYLADALEGRDQARRERDEAMAEARGLFPLLRQLETRGDTAVLLGVEASLNRLEALASQEGSE